MSACGTTVFTRFPQLPAELRRQIWFEALPNDGPAVYLYNWRWRLKYEDPGGEQALHDGIDRERYVEVCSVPEVAFVNREARAAVGEWARARGYTMRFREETQGHCIIRPWDLQRDMLYVGRDQWETFCEHPYDETPYGDMAASIRHLAIPAFTAYYSCEELGEHLFHYMPNLASLSAVWGKVLEPRLSRDSQRPARRLELLAEAPDDYAEVQPRWELEDITDRGEPVTLAALDHTDGSMIYEEGDLDEWMQEIEMEMATLNLPEHVVDREGGQMSLLLRPVTAVRK
ncbi:Uncharacterized protein TPAR_03129 [Tolypocladium paradoxum]|uniref:2EXR domain-containing protein n=1 Tax=Tolypocladium paradoxum TaxID=94208 RepID=A0A2S4L2P7_9HYPO|nr:Uncharacterized protein TPAR_03129 [Tolypocladium paradoxum]